MRLLTLLCLSIICTSCVTAYTPERLEVEGRKLELTAAQQPELAASCIARNIENVDTFWVASIRTLPQGAQEISIRTPMAKFAGLRILIHVLPQNSGSRVTAWIQPTFPQLIDNMVTSQIRAC